MRNVWKTKIIVAAMFLAAAGIICSVDVQAAKKKTAVKVTSTLKKGTLTISGKGAMPASFKVKDKKKVKKVVIKKGVTSISNGAFKGFTNLKTVSIPSSVKKIGWDSFQGTAIAELKVPASVKSIGQSAFSNCKKLKKLTVPGNFKIVTMKGDDGSYSLTGEPGIDTIVFQTNLKIENAAYFVSNNFVVKKDDPNYQSKNGVIYSKDGKSIVRVPFLRTELTLEEGTEEFCLQSILYACPDIEGDPAYSCQLKKIVIPSTLKKIEADKYSGPNICFENDIAVIEIKSRQVDGYSLSILLRFLEKLDMKEVMRQLPDQVTYADDMYITKDGALLRYTGTAENVKVPSGVKIIGECAFEQNEKIKKVELPEGLTMIGDNSFMRSSVKEINLPQSLTQIGDCAFMGSSLEKLSLHAGIRFYGEYVFADTAITELVLPDTLTTIPKGAFSGCTKLKKVVMPDAVKSVGEDAFSDCRALTAIPFSKNMTEIKARAFHNTGWTKLTIPATIKKIGDYAFAENYMEKHPTRKVTIQGSSKQISSEAFNCPGTVLTYTKQGKENRTCLQINSRSKAKKGKIKVSFQWNKITGISGYQVVLSTDSKCKSIKKKLTLKKNKTKSAVTLKSKNQTIYGKIRPYTVVKGKKVYGRWSSVSSL